MKTTTTSKHTNKQKQKNKKQGPPSHTHTHIYTHTHTHAPICPLPIECPLLIICFFLVLNISWYAFICTVPKARLLMAKVSSLFVQYLLLDRSPKRIENRYQQTRQNRFTVTFCSVGFSQNLSIVFLFVFLFVCFFFSSEITSSACESPSLLKVRGGQTHRDCSKKLQPAI